MLCAARKHVKKIQMFWSHKFYNASLLLKLRKFLHKPPPPPHYKKKTNKHTEKKIIEGLIEQKQKWERSVNTPLHPIF